MIEFKIQFLLLSSNREHKQISAICEMSSAAVANPMVSAFDKVAYAIKIQRWWRKIKSDAVVVEDTVADDVLECAICYEAIGDRDSTTTTCGHKFHFSCLAKTQTARGSDGLPCPMCRNPLVEADANAQDIGGISSLAQEDYDAAYLEGYEMGVSEAEERLLAEADRDRYLADMQTQSAYDSGVVDGRSTANEDLRLMREQLTRIKQEHDALRRECGIMRAELDGVKKERDAARWVASRHASVQNHKENSKI